jgi:hypothetical protein
MFEAEDARKRPFRSRRIRSLARAQVCAALLAKMALRCYYPLTEVRRMDSNKQIGTAAAFAQVIWVVAGLFLYMISPGVALLSVSAALYFIAGLVAAPVFFGMGFYGLQRAIDSMVPVPAGSPPDAPQRKSFLASTLVIIEVIVIVLAANWAFAMIEETRAGVPLRYVSQRDNFDYALKAFSVASSMEEQAKPGRESGNIDAAVETRLVELIEAGVARGSAVGNEFLVYLHPELPDPYRTQLLRGYEMLARGRRNGDLALQTEGNDLVGMFYQDFLPSRADSILGKLGVGAQLVP